MDREALEVIREALALAERGGWDAPATVAVLRRVLDALLAPDGGGALPRRLLDAVGGPGAKISLEGHAPHCGCIGCQAGRA